MGFFLGFAILTVICVLSGILSAISMRRVSQSPEYQTHCEQIKAMPTFETYRKLVRRSYIVDAVLFGIIFLQLVAWVFLPIMFGIGSIFNYVFAMAKGALSVSLKAGIKDFYLWRWGFVSGGIVAIIGAFLAYLIYIIVRLGQGITEKEIYGRFAKPYNKTPKKSPISAPIQFCLYEVLFAILPRGIFWFTGDLSLFSYNLLFLIPFIVVGLAVFICGIVFCVLENQAAKDFFAESCLVANDPPSA